MKRGTANVAAVFSLHKLNDSKILWHSLIIGEKKTKIDTASGYAAAMGMAVADMTTRLVSKLKTDHPSVKK